MVDMLVHGFRLHLSVRRHECRLIGFNDHLIASLAHIAPSKVNNLNYRVWGTYE